MTDQKVTEAGLNQLIPVEEWLPIFRSYCERGDWCTEAESFLMHHASITFKPRRNDDGTRTPRLTPREEGRTITGRDLRALILAMSDYTGTSYVTQCQAELREKYARLFPPVRTRFTVRLAWGDASMTFDVPRDMFPPHLRSNPPLQGEPLTEAQRRALRHWIGEQIYNGYSGSVTLVD